jgi:hypothetical protein
VYASIAYCQLLIITDKKKYVNRKTTCGCVAFAVGVGAIFATETAVLTNLNNERLGCTDFCPGQDVGGSFNFSARTIVMISYVALIWLPSVVILLISTIWSCIVFKKRYTGGNDQLNRRLISLPIILPVGFITPRAHAQQGVKQSVLSVFQHKNRQIQSYRNLSDS